MKFGDIIRQPLPVATFTFLVVVIVAFVRAWVTQRFAGEIPAVSAPLGYYTAALRLSWPLLSAAASIVMLFVAGFLIGRSSVRAELYATRCFLAMPLFGVVSCGVLLSSDYLTQSLTLLLLALASRNYYNSFHRHYCFDRMFRGSLYVGLIPLLYAPGAGLLLLIPLVVLLFRRTLREVAVAVAGLLLPALTLCYVNWAAGGEFLAQVAEPGSAFIAGTPLSLFLSTPVQNLVLPGAVFLLDLTALLFFLSDIYALGTKPRLIFIFNISALLLTAAALCGPAATPATVALAAVPSAVLLPFMFVRIHRAIALPLYLLLLASAVISAVLQ